MTVRSLSTGPLCRFLCVVLSISMATGPVMVARAEQPAAESPVAEVTPPQDLSAQTVVRERGMSDTTLLAPPHAGKLDLTYVSPNAVAVAVLRPRQLMTAKATQLLPVEVASAAGLQYLGVDPADVDQIVAFVEAPLVGPPQYGAAIRLAKPMRVSEIPEELRAHTQPGEVAGQGYLESTNPMLPSIYAPDDRTLIIAPDVTLRRLVAAADKPKSGPLVDQIHDVAAGNDLYAAVDLAALRPLLAMGLAIARTKTPPEVHRFFEVPDLVKLAELTFNVSNTGPTSLVLHANDEDSAKRLVALAEDAVKLWRNKVVAEIEAEMAKGDHQDDPVAQAYLHYVKRISESQAAAPTPERHGATITLFHAVPGDSQQQQQLVMVAVIGMLVALLLPAVQSAREAARQNQSMNNMKQLMLALLNYWDAHRTLPAHAIYSDDGKPLLSWRVQILPYLEEGELYKEFHLDEPWDSPHNRALIARMPEVFQNPNLPDAEGKTDYLAVVGEPCVFDGTAKGTRLEDIRDGTSATIALVEADADHAVIWTKPDDWQYDPAHPTAGLGHMRHGVWLAGWLGGHISAVANDIAPDTVKALFTCNGNENVSLP